MESGVDITSAAKAAFYVLSVKTKKVKTFVFIIRLHLRRCCVEGAVARLGRAVQRL